MPAWRGSAGAARSLAVSVRGPGHGPKKQRAATRAMNAHRSSGSVRAYPVQAGQGVGRPALRAVVGVVGHRPEGLLDVRVAAADKAIEEFEAEVGDRGVLV